MPLHFMILVKVHSLFQLIGESLFNFQLTKGGSRKSLKNHNQEVLKLVHMPPTSIPMMKKCYKLVQIGGLL